MTANGGEPLTLRGHRGYVSSVAFSQDGKRIVSGGTYGKPLEMAGEIVVWNAETGRRTLTLPRNLGPVESVCFSPDGKRIVSDSARSVKIWNSKTGNAILTLKGHKDFVRSVAYSPDGKKIVSASSRGSLLGTVSGEIKVWDAETGNEALILAGQTDRRGGSNGKGLPVNCVSFSPDGKRIVGGGNGNPVFPELFRDTGKLKVWDAETGKVSLILGFPAVSRPVSAVGFSPDNKRIVTGSFDSMKVIVWDSNTGRKLLTLDGHTHTSDPFGNGPEGINSVGFSPDGRWIVSGAGGTVFHAPRPPPGPDGKYTKRETETIGEVKIWNAETGKEALALEGHSEKVASVKFSPDGKRIVSGSYDGTVKIWDISRLKP